MGESFVLCTAAFLFAIVIVYIILPTFNHSRINYFHPSYLFDLKLIFGILAAIVIVTGFLAGFYPALVLSKYNPVQTLYNRLYIIGKKLLTKGIGSTPIFTGHYFDRRNSSRFIPNSNFLINKKLGYDDSNIIIVRKMGNETATRQNYLKKSY